MHILFIIRLPDETKGCPRLVLGSFGGLYPFDLFEQPSHDVGSCTHRVLAFDILRNLPLLASVSDVPILGGDDRHIQHL